MSMVLPGIGEGRRAGVLMHPASLPGAHKHGALGAPAEAFAEFMQRAGLRVWQMLPISPVHEDRSPYRALSLNAGGEHLIDLPRLRGETWMRCGDGTGRAGARERWLTLAARCFIARAPATELARMQEFAERQRDWLEPYCAYRVLRRRYRGAPWQHWPEPWRDGAAQAFALLSRQRPQHIQRERVLQYLFDRQWQALRRRAGEANIALYGDLPFYPAPDSVDVWRHRDLFQLDENGWPRATAGVPPDSFAPQGQAWGAALYDWTRMAADDFSWWRERLRVQGQRFDYLRLDHFRGFQAYWSIPAGAAPAAGRWCPGPGAALLRALRDEPGSPVLVAEDLGMITAEVESLRRQFQLPGMRVLQFAFDGDPDNPHLPRNHPVDVVACTGTHDNDTLVGWWRKLDGGTREQVRTQLALTGMAGPESLQEALLASPAALAILPMQDILGLDSRARMNIPGQAGGNWRWRLRGHWRHPELADRLRAALERSHRL